MPVNFQIDFSWLWKKILNNAVPLVEETTNKVFLDVKIFSPIKTWKYASQHRLKWVRIEKNRVIWEVENSWEYSERVEVWFRKNAVNWNLKNLWQLYYSKGANVYSKAIAKNKDYFLKKLKWQ